MPEPLIEQLQSKVAKAKEATVAAAVAYRNKTLNVTSFEAFVDNLIDAERAYHAATIEIAYWGNYTWCFTDEIDEHLTDLECSDDFRTFRMDANCTDADIEDAVRTRIAEDAMVSTY